MKKTIILITVMCIMLNAVMAAEYSASNAYGWLASKGASDGSFTDVVTTSWAVLAFDKAAASGNAEKSLDWIFSQQSDNYCFPQQCRTKDTAMALLAMNKLQRLDNATNIQDKLKEMLNAASLSGRWLIEVSTDKAGSCKLSWQVRNQSRDKTVAVDKGKFAECGNSYFLDVDSCVSAGIISNPGTSIEVDCTGVEDANAVISLVYRNGNNFYLLSSTPGNKATVVVNNGCFGTTPGGSCAKEPTLYAGWALKEAGNTEVDTKIYLLDTYSDTSADDNSLLYLATNDVRYLAVLKTLQKTDGSFDKNVMKTALAAIALKKDSAYAEQAGKAVEWLKSKQKADGSFGTEMETAAALTAITESAVDVPGGYVPPENVICDEDLSCDSEAGEDETNCPEDCPATEEDDKSITECNEDEICDADEGETTDNCPSDCSCGDDVCDDTERYDETCEDDCPADAAPPATTDTTSDTTGTEGSSSTTWIIIALIALIVIGGLVLGMKKMGLIKQKPKPGAPGYNFPRPIGMPSASPSKIPPLKQTQQQQQHYGPMQRPSSSKDKELDKSLEEARKLLGK